jgi:hypothetical protein
MLVLVIVHFEKYVTGKLFGRYENVLGAIRERIVLWVEILHEAVNCIGFVVVITIKIPVL